MYRFSRKWHRALGAGVCVFLVLIAITGFLLATKGTFSWIRPAEVKGVEIAASTAIVPMHVVLEAAFSVGLKELQSLEDIDRVDFRPSRRHFKVLSKEGYHEVQVEATTGKVLQVARRNDQFIEDLHDFSFLHDQLHRFGLPVVAVVLFLLSVSGIGMFFVPVIRRAKYERSKQANTAPKS